MMIRLAQIAIIALILSVVVSCCNRVPKQETVKESRVKSVYYNEFQFPYEIIEVDGTQYLVNYQGGIIPLVTDSTKTAR